MTKRKIVPEFSDIRTNPIEIGITTSIKKTFSLGELLQIINDSFLGKKENVLSKAISNLENKIFKHDFEGCNGFMPDGRRIYHDVTLNSGEKCNCVEVDFVNERYRTYDYSKENSTQSEWINV